MAAAMAEFAFFLLFYSVPFLALFLLPRLSWLVIGAALASLIVGGLFAAMQRSSGDAGIAAYLTFFVVTLGFASGGVGRLALLALGPKGRGRKATLLGAALSYVTLPALIVVQSKVRETQHRSRYAPPSDECRSRLHEVKLGESRVYLPLLTGIHLSEGRSIEKSSSFYPPEKAREFCERAARGAPRLTAVRIFFSSLETHPNVRFRPPCDRRRPQAWWPALCRFERGKRMEIHSIGLFDPARYDSRTMLSFELDSGEGSGIPVGSHWTRDPDGFARARSDGTTFLRGTTRPGALSPWVGRCVQQSSTVSEEIIWRCWAGYRLSPTVGLTYNFEAGIDTFAEDTRRIDGQVFAIAKSLMQDEGTVPAR
jgi:hypothetical protein